MNPQDGMQELPPGAEAAGAVIMIVYLAILILVIAGLWKTFSKAGEPGWAAIVPIYNLYILCKIAGKPWWWLILLCIPLVGIVVALVVCLSLAKNFGKGPGFAIGLWLLGFIFIPILGFGSAKYAPVAA